jgi:isopentenyl phosphate kinase
VTTLILLKIGGGVITDKSVQYGLREDVLNRLAKEIYSGSKKLNGAKLIIGNGVGSFAHWSAAKYKTVDGFINEESRIGMGWVRHDAVKINQIVFEQLLLANVPVFSFSPSSFISVRDDVTENIFMNPIVDSLEKGMVPLVFGDVMVDSEKGCAIYSTEKTFNELAKYFAKTYEVRVLHISAEEGVYKKGQASIFAEITQNNFVEVKEHLGGSYGVDVSGGMLHKVEECLALTKLGIVSQIVNGMVAGRVEQAIAGKDVKGTTIK